MAKHSTQSLHDTLINLLLYYGSALLKDRLYMNRKNIVQ